MRVLRPDQRSADRTQRRGVVLLAVLVVVVLLTLAAYQYSELMLAEYQAADSYTRSLQARALADSGVHYAAAAAEQPRQPHQHPQRQPLRQPGRRSTNMPVGDDATTPNLQGRFSIIAPLNSGRPDCRARSLIVSASPTSPGKINLNALLQLDSSGQDRPRHAHEAAEHDRGHRQRHPRLDRPRRHAAAERGRERLLLDARTRPTSCKNGPLDSLEELLLVNGVTPQLLFGNDRNRNGVLDPDEDDGNGSARPRLVGLPDRLQPGAERRFRGQPAHLHQRHRPQRPARPSSHTAVGPTWPTYILAYRLYGPAVHGRPGGKRIAGGPPAATSGRPAG